MGVGYTRGQHGGFTIIEVMLFLGITGLLALTLLGGWTTMINTQRYKDSVKSVQSFLQTQYNLVYNVEILEKGDNPLYCRVDGSGEVELTTTPIAGRGQSECVQMGRVIKITNGTEFKAYAVIGVDVQDDTSTTDAASFIAHKPVAVDDESLALTNGEFIVPWQAEVVYPQAVGGGRQNVALAIVRSPLTGSVHTYAVSSPVDTVPDVTAMINPANQAELTLCLDPGVAFAGDRIGVVVRERASAQSFVQTIQGSDLC